jgi:hypothetical protein
VRVDARTDQMRLVRLDDEFHGARIAPAGRRRPAAAAFQRQDQIEHGVSVAGRGDIYCCWLAFAMMDCSILRAVRARFGEKSNVSLIA